MNTKFKLLDLIEEIKEKINDQEYKNLVETLRDFKISEKYKKITSFDNSYAYYGGG